MFDPASSIEANKRVGADLIYTREQDALSIDVWPDIEGDGMGFLNPPGPGKLTKRFWARWRDWIGRGNPGVFFFYQVDHMRNVPPPRKVAQVLLLHKRVKFVGNKHQASWPSALVFDSVCRPKAASAHGQILLWGSV